jgi:hypothetical protein
MKKAIGFTAMFLAGIVVMLTLGVFKQQTYVSIEERINSALGGN